MGWAFLAIGVVGALMGLVIADLALDQRRQNGYSSRT